MTTPEAAATYLKEHLKTYGGRAYVVFNPHGVDPETLPTIWGFNNGGEPGWLHARTVSDDGKPLESHICSDEGYMRSDLGVTDESSPKHDTYKEHYPNGYRMDFVPSHDEAPPAFWEAVARANAAGE